MTSRRSVSLTKRTPSLLTIRLVEVPIIMLGVPVMGSPIGASWIYPMPTRFAPTASAITMPSPVMAGLLVVGMVSPRYSHTVLYFSRISTFAEKPPVAMTTPLSAFRI